MYVGGLKPRFWEQSTYPVVDWDGNSQGNWPGYSYGVSSFMGNQQAFGKLQRLGRFSSVKTHISCSRFCDLLQAGEKPASPIPEAPLHHVCVFQHAEWRCRSEIFCLPTREKVLKKKKKKVCYLPVWKYVCSNISSLRKLLVDWGGFNLDEFQVF